MPSICALWTMDLDPALVAVVVSTGQVGYVVSLGKFYEVEHV